LREKMEVSRDEALELGKKGRLAALSDRKEPSKFKIDIIENIPLDEKISEMHMLRKSGDAVGALHRALSAASTSAPVFNICTGKGTSVRVLAETMAELYQTDITAYYSPARSGEARISVGDPRRAAEQLGFRAETALADGLAITLDLPRARFELKPRIVA